MHKCQVETESLRYWIVVACILLALVMTGVETVHDHTGTASGTSNQCAICISAHATAPAIAFQSLPVLHALENVAVPCRTQGKSTVLEPVS